MNTSIYERITSEIVHRLEQGVVPWRQPWGNGGNSFHPRNAVSRMPYRGINPFVLQSAGFSSPWWLTFNQARNWGGYVRRGERGMPVVFWKWVEEDPDGIEDNREPRKVPLLRYFTVFNVEQCESIPLRVETPSVDFHPIEQCERVVNGMPLPPTLTHSDPRAYYHPDLDIANVPLPGCFNTASHYYATLFHELVHSTGHESRLGRFAGRTPSHFGTEEYGKEELVAEMGAAFLCGICGISPATLDNTASYIQCWIRSLKGDSHLAVHAGGAAQRAADFITRQLTPAE
jgi:antirestriction protein ArdC